MPNGDTFSVPPIGEFVRRYLDRAKESIDPFARNCAWATHRNDLNPNTTADWHMDAEKFCRVMAQMDVKADLALFDPPYSPRQISELYRGIGRECSTKDTQNAALYKRVRDALVDCLADNAVVLSFGWSSAGMGKTRGFEIVEIMLVAHGGAHNDTICLAERRTASIL